VLVSWLECADNTDMKPRLVLGALVVALALPFGLATLDREPAGAATMNKIDASGAALQGAGRLDNQSTVAQQVEEPALRAEFQELLDLTNEARAAEGLAPLTYEVRLAEAAQVHSVDQAQMGKLTHTGSDGSNAGERIARTGYQSRFWGENAAAGFASAASVMDGWMDSPGHRANILEPSVTEVGFGLAHTSDGYPYWTQAFAAPR